MNGAYSNIHPKKSLGQNYLVDGNICRSIVDSFNITESDKVVEIGPGRGAITQFILEKNPHASAIEYDIKNIEYLSTNFPGLNLIHANILKTDFEKVFGSNEKLRIIGNIPYNITTEIIFKLIDSYAIVKDAQLMVQEEVAQRLAAVPSTKDYGIPTVLLGVFASTKLMFKVPRTCFFPKPRVDSRIIQIDFTNNRVAHIKDIVFFRKFVKASFSTRRKTLRNAIKKLELNLELADFDFGRRAESLTIDEFIELSNKFC
jgi:16S rRNA (adenine1518-N6/adenine1519-N6)-dimethyltransferase